MPNVAVALATLADKVFRGAVKSNVGHLEGSSGIAGIIKAISAVEKGIIPPNTNFEELNPQIDAEFFNIKVICDAFSIQTSTDLHSSLQRVFHGQVRGYGERL